LHAAVVDNRDHRVNSTARETTGDAIKNVVHVCRGFAKPLLEETNDVLRRRRVAFGAASTKPHMNRRNENFDMMAYAVSVRAY
jgi:hypothetical protein